MLSCPFPTTITITPRAAKIDNTQQNGKNKLVNSVMKRLSECKIRAKK